MQTQFGERIIWQQICQATGELPPQAIFLHSQDFRPETQ